MSELATRRLDAHNPAPDGTPVPRVCQSCEARHRGICGVLTPEELAHLSKVSGKKLLAPGDTLVADEERVVSFANILTGVVKLTKILADGRQQIVGLQFAPDFLGRPFSKASKISIEAATSVSLCTFPRAELERMLRDVPGFEHRLHEQSLAQLDEAREWMVTLGRKSAREKVASFLVMIARHSDPAPGSDEDGPVTFDLPLTRADMADFLGLTIETVSRQLTALRKTGAIRLESNRHVIVPDIDRLEGMMGD